jgi:hypothetical protein
MQTIIPCNYRLSLTRDDDIQHDLLYGAKMQLTSDPCEPKSNVTQTQIVDSEGNPVLNTEGFATYAPPVTSPILDANGNQLSRNQPRLDVRQDLQLLPGDVTLNINVLIRGGQTYALGIVEAIIDPAACEAGKIVRPVINADLINDVPDAGTH